MEGDGGGDELARGRPGTVRTPPIILFSLPWFASLPLPFSRTRSSLSSSSLRLFYRSLSRHFLPRRRLLLPSRSLCFSFFLFFVSFFSVFVVVAVFSASIEIGALLWHSVLLAVYSACKERVRLSCSFTWPPRHAEEEAANYRRYTRFTRAH